MEEGDQELERLEREVQDLESRLKEMRRTGPAAFRCLLDDYLRKLRPPECRIQAALPSLSGSAVDEEVAMVQAKLTAATNSLPALLERINRCTNELDMRLARLSDQRAHSLLFEASPLPSPEAFSSPL